ncbi:MAG: hypothetical protein OXF98_08355, partial [Rhodospirillaceae bacterium]|nr:hypothetical protein [Rhodospirillaceae bacterium]
MASGRFSCALVALAAAFLFGLGAAPAAAGGASEAGFEEPVEGILVPAGSGVTEEPAAGAEGEPVEGGAGGQDTEAAEVDVEEPERR